MAAATFFVSYTAADRSWAEWIAWQLEATGYATILQAWDFPPGSNFVHQMQQAVQRADRTIAVLSPAYFGSAFGEAEWGTAFAKDPAGEQGLLLPIRVQACKPPGLLSTLVYIDLVGLDEATARERLWAGVRQAERPGRPQAPPAFPGLAVASAGLPAPMFPGAGPAVSNLAPRNRNFTGRANLLGALNESLAAGTTAVVAAYGLGGVGKSQLALEYAYRHAADYDLVWWMAAETPLSAAAGLAALAPRLGLPTPAEQAQQVAAVLAELARRDRWLLVFDNAERPQDLTDYLPRTDGGQVIVTSRNPVWGRVAARLRVDVLDPAEAAALLVHRTDDPDLVAAAALADELGGLPLALAQAAAYCEQTSLPLADYLTRYRRDHARLLARILPENYPVTVGTTWGVSVERAAQACPAALPLLRLAAFLAPEVLPLDLLGVDPAALPASLAAAATDEFVLDEAVGVLYGYSLVTRDQAGIRLHRLVQTVIHDDLPREQAADWAACAVGLVFAAFPHPPEDPRSWPRAAMLLPHALVAANHAEAYQVALAAAGELLTQVGRYLSARAELPAARASLEHALVIREAAWGPTHPQVAFSLGSLGLVLRKLGDRDGARQHLQRALAIVEAAYPPDHSQVAIILDNLGLVLRDLGDFNSARQAHKRALNIEQAAWGPDHRDVAITLDNLGLVLRELGDLDGARQHLQRALAIVEAAFGPEDPEVATTLEGLGLVLRDLGDLDGARRQLERSLAIVEGAYPPDHPEVASALGDLGVVLEELGDLDGARQHLQRALTISEGAYPPDHPQVGAALGSLGVVLRDLGDLNGARRDLERAVAIFTESHGAEHPDTRRAKRYLNDLT